MWIIVEGAMVKADIPKDVARVDVRAEGGQRAISLPLRRYTLEKLLANVTPEGMREAFDWGPDVGQEIVDD